MKRISLIILILSCLPLLAGVSDSYYRNPSFNFNSLINPNQVDMHHSFTFQSGMNSQGNGYYLNMYTNHLNFSLHPKLDMKVDINFVNYGSMSANSAFDIEGNNDNSTLIMPEFEMEWRPNENMKISFGFQRGVNNSLFYNNHDNDLFDD